MKKIALLAVFLLAIGLVAGVAEDKPLTLSGSVGWSVGDDDVKLAPGPAFSADKTGMTATFKLGTASDKVEAGVTLNLLPSITKTSGVDAFGDLVSVDPSPAIAMALKLNASGLNGYDQLQGLADWAWYKVNNGTYLDVTGADVPFGAIFDAANWDALVTTTAIVSGTGPWTIVDTDDIDPKPVDLSADIGITFDSAMGAWGAFWQAMSVAVPNFALDGDGAAFVIENGTADQIAAAKAMVDFYNDWKDGVFDEATDDTWASSFPVSNAYLKVKKVFGVVDIMGEIEGRPVGVGSMVVSAKNGTSGNDENVGLSVALSEGVVSGLSASVLVTGADADMAAETSQDYTTMIDETAAAVEPIWGAQIDLGYATKMFGATVQFGVADLMATPFKWIASIQPFVSLADIAGLSLKGEFNLIGTDPIAMGAGASLSASIMGIAPSVGFYWKDANFGGDDSYTTGSGADSITTDSGLLAEFDSIDDAAAAALALAASVDLKDLMKMKLVTLSGGFDMMLIGGTENGWNAGVGFDFADVLKKPVTLSFNISKWAAEDLLWSGVLGYTYDKLGVTFTLAQTEADVIGWTLAGKITL